MPINIKQCNILSPIYNIFWYVLCLDACPDNSFQRQCVLFTFVYFLSSQWGGIRHATQWVRATKNVKNQMFSILQGGA